MCDLKCLSSLDSHPDEKDDDLWILLLPSRLGLQSQHLYKDVNTNNNRSSGNSASGSGRSDAAAAKTLPQYDAAPYETEGLQYYPKCDWCGTGDQKGILILDGNVVCTACLTITSRWIDGRAEWRNFMEDGLKKSRCCTSASASHVSVSRDSASSLGCYIASRWQQKRRSHPIGSGGGGGGGGDPGGATDAPTADMVNYGILQRMQSRHSRSYKERTLSSVFDCLYLDATQHGLAPCIMEDAKGMYKHITGIVELKGELRCAMMSASVYMACKRNGVPRSMREVSDICSVRMEALSKGYRVFQQHVGPCPKAAPASSADDYVARFCSRLALCDADVARVRELLKRVDTIGEAEMCTPPALVSGVIRVICDQPSAKMEWRKSARFDIADACKVSPATVTKSYNIVRKIIAAAAL